ncbi:helix-turn-helix domain-containing protein [Diplocloster modestus]|uniref:Helix-turn-helix transcriptional regulator n=1 Tax=Diplocloster modestus TaxID=2850322 RepID=A0ABS6K0M6_9FIRM|nr:helix-turn-helix transcriptional regulator [Diplocloster modestus]MBU9724399.1 helix-turn-helix transcriptional regulator [Diplocloster modestus]
MADIPGINFRFKKLRNKTGSNQEDFGKKLGITKSAISRIESGLNGVSEQNIMALVREYGVNEVWLRTGLGGEDSMFVELSDDDRYSISLGKLGRTENEFVQNAINAIAETKPEDLKIIEEFMKKCLGIK